MREINEEIFAFFMIYVKFYFPKILFQKNKMIFLWLEVRIKLPNNSNIWKLKYNNIYWKIIRA